MLIFKKLFSITWPFLVPVISKMNTSFVEIWPAFQNAYVILTFYHFYLEHYFSPMQFTKKCHVEF